MSELQTKEDYKQYKLELHQQMLMKQNIGILTKKEIRFKDRQQYLILWRTKDGRVYQYKSCS